MAIGCSFMAFQVVGFYAVLRCEVKSCNPFSACIQIITDPRVVAEVEFAEGDYVVINNYTTMHGRTPFTGERELWRIQLAPPSDNVPWQQEPVRSNIRKMAGLS